MNIERHAVRGEHVEIPVTGMGCAQRIQWAPSKLDGVIHITVSHAEAKAHIHYSPDQILVKQIIEAIREAGYQASEPLSTNKTVLSRQE